MFHLRDYEKRDFEAIFQLDRLCFDPSIAYSRPELASFIERRQAFTIVAEWDGLNSAPSASLAAAGTAHGEASGRGALRSEPARRPVAGFTTCHFQKQGYGHIITIDVHPDARRNHLGTLLVEATCERLRRMTAFMVVLEVAVNNHSALAFYDRFGFKRVKVLERYYSRDLDAVFMTKRL